MRSILEKIREKIQKEILHFIVKSLDDLRYTITWLAIFEMLKIDDSLTLDEAFTSGRIITKAFMYPKETEALPIEFYKDLTIKEKLALQRLKSNSRAKLAFNLNTLSIFVYRKDDGDIDYQSLRINKERLKQVKKYSGKIQIFTFKEYKQNVKRVKKEISKEATKLMRERSEEKFFDRFGNVTIDSNAIISSVSIISVIGLLAGILYNHIFYGGLGVNAGEIMTATDYIYVSLPAIGQTMILSFVLLLLWTINTKIDYRSYYTYMDFGVVNNKKVDWYKIILFLLICGIVGFNYFVLDTVLYFLLPIIVIYLYAVLTPKLRIFDFFKSSLAAYYITLAIICIFLNIYVKANNDLSHYYDGKLSARYKVEFNNGLNDKYKDFTPLKITSENIIMFKKNDKKDIIVLPKTNIESYHYIESE